MKPIMFALVAIFFYAASNVLMELKFSKYNNLTLVVASSLIVALVTSVIRIATKTEDPSFNFPTGNMVWWIIVLGLMYTIADCFYMGAYTNGGSIIAITCVSILLPIFASVIKFLLKGALPTPWHIAGYLLAVGAVLFVIKGNEVLNTAN